jgi:lysine 2,3-aminomutase
MDRFIGRPGVFLPKVIIVDKHGNHVETTNRTKLPSFEKMKKAKLLSYEVNEKGMPITNPAKISKKLDELFLKQKTKQVK